MTVTERALFATAGRERDPVLPSGIVGSVGIGKRLVTGLHGAPGDDDEL